MEALAPAQGVDGGVAGGGQEVRAEGHACVDAAQGLGLEDLHEGVGHRVGGVVGVGGDGLGHPPRGFDMAAVELVEGGHVAAG